MVGASVVVVVVLVVVVLVVVVVVVVVVVGAAVVVVVDVVVGARVVVVRCVRASVRAASSEALAVGTGDADAAIGNVKTPSRARTKNVATAEKTKAPAAARRETSNLVRTRTIVE